jgi:hypothetical protein
MASALLLPMGVSGSWNNSLYQGVEPALYRLMQLLDQRIHVAADEAVAHG